MAPTSTEQPRPALAGEIVVTRGPGGKPFSLTVDGVEFPHLIDAGHGIGVHLSDDDIVGAVSLTILAETVRVVDEIGVVAPAGFEPPADFDG